METRGVETSLGYLWRQCRVFAAPEEAVGPVEEGPGLAPVSDEQLHRRESSEADLECWLAGTELPQEARYEKMRSIADSYAHALRKEPRDATLRTIIIALPPLTFRTYQILPHTNSYFHCLNSYLDLLQ